MVKLSTVAAAFGLLCSLVTAHPGHDPEVEALKRRAFLQSLSIRSLDHCAAKLKARGIDQKMRGRRKSLAQGLRVENGHNEDGYSKASGHKPVQGWRLPRGISPSANQTYSLNTPEDILFSDNSSCLLQPEGDQGPYYVSGELIRSNVTDGQTGVDMHIDIQILDYTTCDPLPDVYLDIWHCNSTGVYSGVVANGNGNTNDTANLNSTAFRGIQKSDRDGVVQFSTIFPGHYSGRATHIHIIAHHNGTLLSNNTLAGNTSSHTGQIFFDQDLITEVEATYPYNTNTIAITPNVADSIYAQQEGNTTRWDVQYVFLGDSIEDGLLSWVTIGINPSNSTEITPAAYYYADGGVENSDSGMGVAPSGAMPSGVEPSGAVSSESITGTAMVSST